MSTRKFNLLKKAVFVVLFAMTVFGAHGAFAQDFCVGDTVMYGHNKVQVTALYADGSADINGQANGNVPVSQLSFPIACMDTDHCRHHH